MAADALTGVDDHDPCTFLDGFCHCLDEFPLHTEQDILVGLLGDVVQDCQISASDFTRRIGGLGVGCARGDHTGSGDRDYTTYQSPCSDYLTARDAARVLDCATFHGVSLFIMFIV